MALQTHLVVLPSGVNLGYVAWETELIERRYDNSTIVTHWDTFLTLSLTTVIFIVLMFHASSLDFNHCY